MRNSVKSRGVRLFRFTDSDIKELITIVIYERKMCMTSNLSINIMSALTFTATRGSILRKARLCFIIVN